MAQTERSPKTNNTPKHQATIAALRLQIATGQTIDAADIQLLSYLINSWVGHTHTYDDAYQLATYGDNGDRVDYYEDKTTQNSGVSLVKAVGAGDIITAAKHNELRDRCNSLRVHDHTINDRITA